jgi:hypothetical protein
VRGPIGSASWSAPPSSSPGFVAEHARRGHAGFAVGLLTGGLHHLLLFGGVTPLLVSWLAHVNRLNPAHYVAAVTVLGLLATLMAPTAQPPAWNVG